MFTTFVEFEKRFRDDLKLRPGQISRAMEVSRSEMLSHLLPSLFRESGSFGKRKADLLGRWESIELKPFMGNGTESTFMRFEFFDDFKYGYASTFVRSRIAGPFAPDAGSSWWSSNHKGDPKWDVVGHFWPAVFEGRKGIRLLLFPESVDATDEWYVERIGIKLFIQDKGFFSRA